MQVSVFAAKLASPRDPLRPAQPQSIMHSMCSISCRRRIGQFRNEGTLYFAYCGFEGQPFSQPTGKVLHRNRYYIQVKGKPEPTGKILHKNRRVKQGEGKP